MHQLRDRAIFEAPNVDHRLHRVRSVLNPSSGGQGSNAWPPVLLCLPLAPPVSVCLSGVWPGSASVLP
eukprot:2815354-Alexandrium_andersonii.AAC.1